MKHTVKITIILLAMFIVTQLIGLVVLNADPFHVEQEVNGTIQKVSNPDLFWIQPPEAETTQESFSMFGSLIIAFILAITLLFFLSKFKIEFILKAWFFLVVCMALFLAFYSFGKIAGLKSLTIITTSLIITLPLAYIKIFKKEFIVHNLTELLIYPGIATLFVPILIWKSAPFGLLRALPIILLLILISLYDVWAVWHSGIMQKMAKYQIDKLNIFAGFFVPYAGKKTRQKIRMWKEKFKKGKISKKTLHSKKFKINVAILGGGDVVFPIIAAGVILKTFGLIPALFVTAGATLGLAYLFFISEKKKFYPAMPFITAGIFAGMLVGYLIS